MTVRLHTLANGVRVMCDPIDGFETLALSVVAGRGARSEDQATNGWAHLLEHMVFKGAGQRSARDIVEAIEAQGGSINAATGYERTSFQVRALKGGLPLGLDVVADLIQRPTLDAAELAREKDVVAQEIAEAADTPDDLVFDLAQTAAFGGQALGRPILGSIESLADATPQDLRAFRAALYAPDRLVVSAAGAVDEDDLLNRVEAAFGGLSGGGFDTPSPAVFTAGGMDRAARLEQAHVVLLLPAPGARDPDYFVLRVFAEALGGGMSSRLFQEVREKRGLAYNIDAYAETYADQGVLGIYAGCSAKDAAPAARLCAEQVVDLAAAIDDAELSRAKAQLKASIFMARESPLARAEQAAGQILLLDHLVGPSDLAAGIDAVGRADIVRLGERILAAGNASGAVLGAKGALGAVDAFTGALFG